MLFTLEALEARHGDCLLLHYGSSAAPKVMLIDGGPRDVYRTRLALRLQQLADSSLRQSPLELRLIVVSHVDDDHIRGILDLTRIMLDAEDGGDAAPATALGLWHNSFEDHVKRVPAAAAAARPTLTLASTGRALPAHTRRAVQHDTGLVLASIPQGRQLAADARRLTIAQNAGFQDGLIVAPSGTTLTRRFEGGVSVTIVGPRQEQLDRLQNDWARWVAERKKAGKLKPAQAMEAAAADFVDRSVYNLSSIVMLVEGDGRTMLLTGDARGDYLLDALHESGLKKEGKRFDVDLLKVPHHGSFRNVEDSLFREVVAKHYVISANGENDNPDVETVDSLLRARPKGRYTIHLTNRKHIKTKRDLPAAKRLDKAPAGVTVVYADAKAAIPAVAVNLGRSKLRD